MAMVCGKRAAKVYRCIKATTRWTKRQAMEFTCGKMDGATKVIFRMTTVMDMVNCMMESVTLTTEVIGRMESRVRGR